MLKLHAEARLAPGDCYDKNNLDFASKIVYTHSQTLLHYLWLCTLQIFFISFLGNDIRFWN